MSSTTILFADDDEAIRDVLNLLLRSEGYNTIAASNGEEVLEQMSDEIDLLILDVMMPKMDGIETCRQVRKKYATPILFLTAKSMEEDKIKGFSVGADDYLVKPFSYTELTMRVNAMLRRYREYGEKKNTNGKAVIELFGDTEIDLDAHTVTKSGKRIKLTEIEYRILLLLASHKKEVFSVQQIYENIWKEQYFYTSNNTVMVHIRNLRKKLGDTPKDSKLIQTVWGKGYKVE
ncbi:response regulator transcription factor [Eubacterium oxidoreducens]|uniref:Stage 0 sporulation protein A homolog n=1 Tax=Eubacterium oxidoreducens TaxID=1732 RepID=A0A1G6CEH6_EUBOX|nr:response regulator transcription factor [Eubacterium oxidoreducens]SDB31267.1 DNA-binding response regulator, OmpR family, contains REC and winged-helix (wHTH) domain [Eubacterium oxidoreducens]